MCVVLFWCMMVYSSVRVLLFVCSTVWLCVLLFWCILLFVGVWWCVLLYFGMFCCVCVGMFYVWLCVDVFCCLCILLCVGVFCCVDVFCYILVCSPRCLCILLCVGVCHCALVCSAVCWCVLMCSAVCVLILIFTFYTVMCLLKHLKFYHTVELIVMCVSRVACFKSLISLISLFVVIFNLGYAYSCSCIFSLPNQKQLPEKWQKMSS